MTVHLFGIRHHGPGSARSLRTALAEVRPDVVLVEGPPDAAEVLSLLAHAEMKPPVALLIYNPEVPQEAVYYPFAHFSPEWQAILYGLTAGVPVRFMDLPHTYQFAMLSTPTAPEATEATEGEQPHPIEADAQAADEAPAPEMPTEDGVLAETIAGDPLRWLAEAAGYADSERWWEHMVEERRDGTDLFAAILEAMTALRDEVAETRLPEPARRFEALREAWMRQTIRAAEREGFERIAVVCGAWHAPALARMPAAKEDAALLKGLPKRKVAATWVPWTYGRLARESGYGAGVESPGWYDHLWHFPDEPVTPWLARVAGLLRDEGLDASTAQVIDAVRMAETLAALRDRPRPGLSELNEATRSVLCFGSDLPLALISQRLIVGERLGAVPDATPMVPLQQDFQRITKRLRLQPEPTPTTLELDLRQESHLERSHLLHRLALLGIPWGQTEGVRGARGTFRERWKLAWAPEFALRLIEANQWGNTVLDAATGFVSERADQAEDLPVLTTLVEQALLAHLPGAVDHLMERLQAEAALASDVGHLMRALPPLANVVRYGNVRQTDAQQVSHVIDGLVARICIGLPPACSSLDDTAALVMERQLTGVHGAVTLLQVPAYLHPWQATLQALATNDHLHGLLAGRTTRLLLDSGVWDADDVARRMGLALSPALPPDRGASWVEGFLQGSGLVLLHDERLWTVLDQWVSGLAPDAFVTLLPLLRRTFATFPAPERQQMGARVRRVGGDLPLQPATSMPTDFDPVRAEATIPLVAELLGIALPERSTP